LCPPNARETKLITAFDFQGGLKMPIHQSVAGWYNACLSQVLYVCPHGVQRLFIHFSNAAITKCITVFTATTR
jgi:hypothetical protein